MSSDTTVAKQNGQSVLMIHSLLMVLNYYIILGEVSLVVLVSSLGKTRLTRTYTRGRLSK